MPDRSSAQRMLAAAERDLKTMKGMEDADAFPVESFGFHAQQAAEKALKAWLSMRDAPYGRTHNLRELLILLEESGARAGPWFDIGELNAFAVQFRYDAYGLDEETLDRGGIAARVGALVALVRAVCAGQGDAV